MPWAKFEGAAYWSTFVVIFLAVAAWESFRPNRGLIAGAERRWKNHGALLLITLILQTVLLRISPVALSLLVAKSRFGILNKPWQPLAVRFLLTFLLLDLLQYGVHWTLHRVPWLWRVHQVHHSDAEYDVSTAGRFHPIEVLMEQSARLGAIALLAPPPVAVLAAELGAMILNLGTHANASLPAPVERILRFVFITPDVHRIHHSEQASDQQRNFGQTFLWWDRLFGTYRAAAAKDFPTGLKGFENCDRLSIPFLLAEPFHEIRPGEPALNTDPLIESD